MKIQFVWYRLWDIKEEQERRNKIRHRRNTRRLVIQTAQAREKKEAPTGNRSGEQIEAQGQKPKKMVMGWRDSTLLHAVLVANIHRLLVDGRDNSGGKTGEEFHH